jgi:branched-chain amino acid transport system permease protein
MKTLGVVGVLVAALALPQVGGEGYLTHMAILLLIFSVLASSLNLLMGYTGLVSIAHAAFFGIGAYTSGALLLRTGLSFWLALPAAAVVTGVVALGIGLPSFRTRGVYYIIVTVAFQLIASELFDNWYELTGGGLGLRGVPRPPPLALPFGTISFDSKVSSYYLVLAFAVALHGAVIAVLRSPLGVALQAVRDNETKARMMGLNPLVYKTFAFVFAAVLAGIAGSLYAHYLEYAHPDFFSFAVSVDLFLAVMLGGVGTLWGPMVGVVLLEVIRELLQEFAKLRLLLFGTLLVVLMVFLPEGLLTPVARWYRRTYAGPSPR